MPTGGSANALSVKLTPYEYRLPAASPVSRLLRSGPHPRFDPHARILNHAAAESRQATVRESVRRPPPRVPLAGKKGGGPIAPQPTLMCRVVLMSTGSQRIGLPWNGAIPNIPRQSRDFKARPVHPATFRWRGDCGRRQNYWQQSPPNSFSHRWLR